MIDGELTLGQLAAFNLYLAILVWPLRTLGQRVQTVQQAVAAAMRITEVLESEPAVVEPASPKRLVQQGAADVAFEDVVFGYEPRRPVLDGFSLEIPAGTSVALVGGTGSGKTTAAALLSRFYDPQFGRVLVGGVDVRELRVDDLRHTVGIVFEDTFLFSDTVAANIAFARPDASARRSSPRRAWAARTSSSRRSRSATTRCSASEGSRSRAASVSGSRSRARSSPTLPC